MRSLYLFVDQIVGIGSADCPGVHLLDDLIIAVEPSVLVLNEGCVMARSTAFVSALNMVCNSF